MAMNLSPANIIQLGVGFWGPKTLLSAIELGVFSELATGALTAESLRGRLRLHPRSARDFFDALVALGMLERQDGLYSEYARNRPFPRPGKAHLCRGLSRDDQCSPLWLLGRTHRGPSQRRATERN